MTKIEESTVDTLLSAADPELPPRPRRRWHRVVPVMLSVVLVGLLAASGWLWWSGRQVLDDAPVAVARQEAQNFFSLSYHQAPADTARVLDLATGAFKQQYTAQQTSVQQGLISKALTLTAQVPDNGTAIEYEHGDSAQVLVAVNATTTTTDGKNQVNRYRVRVDLTREQDRWLVSAFNQVG
jgi:Mce-associated membrane protein